jgi:hypothetical protein
MFGLAYEIQDAYYHERFSGELKTPRAGQLASNIFVGCKLTDYPAR